MRRHPTIPLGATVLVAMVAIAILAPLLGTMDPTATSLARRLREPSAQFPFGTDMLGRDLYSRVLYGARISLLVGFSVAIFSSLGGLLLGLIAGFMKRVDVVVMRIMDGLMAIPGILLAIAMMALTKASVENVIIAITIPEVPRVVRLVRGVVLQIREQPYIEAAQSIGTRFHRILLKHILPNIMADRKSTRLNSSHTDISRMPSSA